jgi:hypothetical protein
MVVGGYEHRAPGIGGGVFATSATDLVEPSKRLG